MTDQVRRATDIVQHELDGRYLLLRVGRTDVLHLNDVASRLWEALGETSDVRAATEAVAVAYDVPADQLRVDVAPVIALLLQHGLLLAP